jgi:hypothetical protein
VAGVPIAIVWWLRFEVILSSVLVGLIVGMALSLGASVLGRLVWEKRPDSEDVLFSELMIWGYLHRWRTQRQLGSALSMVEAMSEAQSAPADSLSATEQAKLLGRLVTSMETRDPYLHGHSRRVARHSWMIAKQMGLPRAEMTQIRAAAALHDVGKIKTPKAILHKPASLTDSEYETIKMHPGDGAQMVEVLCDPQLTSMVRHHHERLDGSGYPDGLRGQPIPLGARIIAVADTFDAITSARPYRSASPHEKAIAILKQEAGTKLDPAVVRAFCSHYAGRGPVALWSLLAVLPERAISWLSTGATGLASAVKVAAVAALVGGAAVSSATLGVPVAARHTGERSAKLTTAIQVRGGRGSLHTALVDPGSAAPPSHPTPSRERNVALHPRVRVSSAAQHTTDIQATGLGPTSGGHAEGAESSTDNAVPQPESETSASGKSAEARGQTEVRVTKGKGEAAHAKAEQTTGKGKDEAAHAKTEETTSKGKSEAAHAKTEETTSKGKSEEPPLATGKSEEAHAKKGATPAGEGA